MKKDDPLNAIDQAFFTYMLANAVLNAIYSFSFLLYYSIPCIPIKTLTFDALNCTVLDKWMWTVTSVLKLMANFSFLLISLNRYLLVGKDHAEWVKFVADAHVKIVTCITFVCSCLLSAITYYQIDTFSINKQLLIEQEYGLVVPEEGGEIEQRFLNTYYYYSSYSMEYRGHNPDGAINIVFSQLKSTMSIVIGFILVRDVMSYFLFCIFNLAIDVMTVKKLNESLAEKAKLSSLDKHDEQMRAERRCVFMVILNSCVNVLLRLPELLTIVFYIIVEADVNGLYIFKMLCITYNRCQTLNDIANPFYIISLSSNVLFYYFFNKTFKAAFLKTFSICTKKK
jgi:hypothetical protein